jgi:hypothetical protein
LQSKRMQANCWLREDVHQTKNFVALCRPSKHVIPSFATSRLADNPADASIFSVRSRPSLHYTSPYVHKAAECPRRGDTSAFSHLKIVLRAMLAQIRVISSHDCEFRVTKWKRGEPRCDLDSVRLGMMPQMARQWMVCGKGVEGKNGG